MTGAAVLDLEFFLLIVDVNDVDDIVVSVDVDVDGDSIEVGINDLVLVGDDAFNVIDVVIVDGINDDLDYDNKYDDKALTSLSTL